MEMDNVVKEIYLLRARLLEAVTQSPLPFTIKAMVFREVTSTLDSAEAREMRAKTNEKKKGDIPEDKKE